MSRPPTILQPLAFPLKGSALIEASAGTGKTFTIAALYLRLVLGHGGEHAFTRPLTPPDILVVTFTEAATKELRDRIRGRLAEAAELFASGRVREQPDLLDELRDEYPRQEWPKCAEVLRLAAEWMDEAAVSTIHGWCNRMLREHAFDSGSLFTQKLEADDEELFAEAVRDYWREHFYPLDAAHARAVCGWWDSPQDLAKEVSQLMAVRDQAGPGQAPAEVLEQARQACEAVKARWRGGWIPQLRALYDAACEKGQLNGNLIRAKSYPGWFDQLQAWVDGPEGRPFDSDGTAAKRLTAAGLREAWKDKKSEPFDHPGLHDMATLFERLASVPDARPPILCHAAHWVARRVAGEKRRRAEMGFDDLLVQLDRALQDPASGPALAARIRSQFPVALIDEFQDTDPLQYRIFDAVYGIARNAQDTAVILIGDPKQAIYGFRGADIHTYLAARRDTDGRHATLGTNFRSSQPMVDAVNGFFLQAERRADGRGAFLFRQPGDDPVPFFPVDARGRQEGWQVEGQDAPALTCWWREEGRPLGKEAYRQGMAAACAGEIVRLLRLGQEGRAGFAEDGQPFQPLLPKHMAVLVNDRREARAVREALGDAGVRSVYLSDRDSVFRSPVAQDVQRLLLACAEPDDDRVLRAGLATALLGLDWAELERLNEDDLHWEERVLQFRNYRAQWQRQGVLPMLRKLVNDFGVAARLLGQGEERRLTDVLHLAELLQEASATLDGEHALVRWLAEQRQAPNAGGDAQQVRLESDAELLKVVTVHKSKGLEYPLVFLPFASSCRAAKADDLPLKWHEEGAVKVAIGDDAALRQVDDERLAEDLRKLYVAMTRARHATWLGIAPVGEFERTAVGYLLTGDAPLAAPLAQVLQAALGAQAAVLPAPAAPGTRYEPASTAIQLAPEPPLGQGQREAWWIASYSGLKLVAATEAARIEDGQPALDPAQPVAPASALEDRFGEDAGDANGAPEAGGLVADPDSLHAFPRGAGPGSFLHDLLQWVAEQGFEAVLQSPRELQAMLERRCAPRRWQRWVGPLRDWMLRWLDTPLRLDALGGSPVRPADLRVLQVEMEFWFAAQEVDALKLDALVRHHTLDGEDRPALQPRELNGMLKGFMDLVFEHEGRWYVADYKSNRLGEGDAAYRPRAMRDEVLKHRYELQYTLYLFALHRLLRARLPDYDYDRDVGGAVYLFLRGHGADTQGLHLEKPPRALMDALDALFAGEPVEVPA